MCFHGKRSESGVNFVGYLRTIFEKEGVLKLWIQRPTNNPRLECCVAVGGLSIKSTSATSPYIKFPKRGGNRCHQHRRCWEISGMQISGMQNETLISGMQNSGCWEI
jgi:hypothetical protein